MAEKCHACGSDRLMPVRDFAVSIERPDPGYGMGRYDRQKVYACRDCGALRIDDAEKDWMDGTNEEEENSG